MLVAYAWLFNCGVCAIFRAYRGDVARILQEKKKTDSYTFLLLGMLEPMRIKTYNERETWLMSFMEDVRSGVN